MFMQKAKNVIIGFFIIALLVIAGLYFSYTIKLNNKLTNIDNDNNQTILFYSLTCSHCKIVEKFMEENNVLQKIKITQLEVSQNSANAQQLIKIGKACKLDSNYIGAIPLLYVNSSCYLGDTPIIEYLNKTVESSK
jgi:hypothetical protein